MKVLHTFKQKISIHLDHDDTASALRLLNQHYVQDDHCNKYSDEDYKKLVPKYPEYERLHPEFAQSHRNAAMSYLRTIHIDLMEDGTLQISNITTK